MKFYEAMLHGSTLIKPSAWTRGEAGDRTHGCALGMAEMTMGMTKVSSAELLWPWLSEQMYEAPCGHGTFKQQGYDRFGEANVLVYPIKSKGNVIVHLFNEHVMTGDWTLERLADYIKTIEPEEEKAESSAQAEVEKETECVQQR